MGDRVTFENHRFGEIEVDERELLHFPGLPGFPDARRFVVMEHDRDACFAWLVSMDDPDLAFAIADPWQFFPDYDPPVELRHLHALGVEGPQDLEIMTIAVFSGERASLNLVAPLLINPRSRAGIQVIFDRSHLSHREEIPPPNVSPAPEESKAAARLQIVPRSGEDPQGSKP